MENSELIRKALDYIGSTAGEADITIEDIAKHAGFSTDYFNRIFHAHTGFNIMEYVRFTRLKKAARLLRLKGWDILDIALECGYETHESFTRAFKKQYDLTPSEYRKKYQKEEMFYGEFFNDTVAPRLMHEFPGLKAVQSDEAIDHLLETDPLKNAGLAVYYLINGGVALYQGDWRDGFVWFTEWDGRFTGEILCADYEKTAAYLRTFNDPRFDMILFTLDDDETVTEKLKQYGVEVSEIRRQSLNVYTDPPYPLDAPAGISMRELTFADFASIKVFYYNRGDENTAMILQRLQRALHQKYVLGNTEHSVFLFGIFREGSLIGISHGGLFHVRGFAVNTRVITELLPGDESEELYQYAFKFVTDAALACGALPIDTVQTPYRKNRPYSGAFDSTDLGYKTITHMCIVKYN